MNLPPISLGPMDLENDSLMAVATKEQGTRRLMHIPANVDGTQQAMSFSLSGLGENKGEEFFFFFFFLYSPREKKRKGTEYPLKKWARRVKWRWTLKTSRNIKDRKQVCMQL